VVTPGAKVESSVLGLYSPKTNFHTISRFLPDSIHRFTPYINYGDGNTKGISREQIIERSRVWLGGLTTEIQTRGREVLSLLDTAQSLAKARGEAWAVLQITPTSGVRPEWDQTCQNAFGQTFCLWRDVFRDLFNLRSQEIIKAAFIPLLRFHAEVLVPILTEIEGQTEEKNIGKFVWTEQDDKSAGVIADRSHAFTPAVLRVQQAVDLRLLQIKADVDHIFLIDPPPAGDSPDQDVYHITSDSLILKNSLQRACVDAILEFKTSLEKQVCLTAFPPHPTPHIFSNSFTNIFQLQEFHDLLESSSDQPGDKMRPLIFEKALFTGRVAKCISSRPKSLHSLLQLSSQVSVDTSKLRRQYLTGLKGQKSESDTVLEKLQQYFVEVYISSHSGWLRWLAQAVSQLVRTGLFSSDWKDMSKKQASWEAVGIEEEGEKDAQQTYMQLPSHTSLFLTEALFFLSREIHRQCGHTLDRSVVRLLLVELTQRLLAVYQEFVKPLADAPGNVSDKGAVQLLFDLQFASRILSGSWEGSSKAAEYQASFTRLQVAVKAKIDPIDLAIYENHVGRHVERHYARTAVLFGTITSLNEPILEGYPSYDVAFFFCPVSHSSLYPSYSGSGCPHPRSSTISCPWHHRQKGSPSYLLATTGPRWRRQRPWIPRRWCKGMRTTRRRRSPRVP